MLLIKYSNFKKTGGNNLSVTVCRKGNEIVDVGGYTLIEVVLTMFIAATVFVGVYALFAKAMNYDTEGRMEIIASELVQEGVEMIKNKREKNEMDWAIWNGVGDIDNLTTFKDIDNLNDCNPSLTWDVNGDNYNFQCSVVNTNIRFNKTTKRYETNCGAGSCVGTQFTRKCTTDMIDTNGDGSGDSLKVDCVVSWASSALNGDAREVKANLILTDWER